MSARRSNADRLWPVLLGLVALVSGALALEQYARRRGNRELAIAIEDRALEGDDEEAGDSPDGPAEELGAAANEAHARARLAARRGELEEALRLLSEAAGRAPDSGDLQLELGYWRMRNKELDAALPHLLKARELKPGSADVAVQLGALYARRGQLPEAELELRRALKLREGYRPALVALGAALRKQGRLEEALALLERAATSGGNEQRARALAALGAAYLASGRRSDAEKSFDQAIQFAPARTEIRLAIARAYQATDTPEDLVRSREILERAASLAPDLAPVFSALGRAHERLGEAEQAERAYERALRLEPSYRFARRRLIRLALERRDYGRARLEAERLLRDAPSEAEHAFLAALVEDRDNQVPEARRLYEQAVSLAKGQYPEAYLNLGALERSAGRYAEAERAYRTALAQRPAYAAAHTNLAKLFEAQQRTADAEASYREALKLDPRAAPAWLGLGELLSRAGRGDEAVAAFQRALEGRPGYAAALLSLGVAHARAKRYPEAEAAYRQFLEVNPRSVAGWYNLGIALEAQGRRAPAHAALARALELDASHLPSLRLQAALHSRDGKLAEARRVLEELLDAQPRDRAARIELAELLLKQGDAKACHERASELGREAPDDPEVKKLLEECP